MLTTKNMFDSSRNSPVWAVAFHPDRIHLFSGSSDEIRRWRVADGQVVAKRLGMNLGVISIKGPEVGSVWDYRGGKRLGCTNPGKGHRVDSTENVAAVDISPNATRFAAGSDDSIVSIWNIFTGERLVGPLQHDHDVAGVKFSPNGECVATACEDSIHVFDSHNGDQLVTIKADLNYHSRPLTPLGWSTSGQQIFYCISQ